MKIIRKIDNIINWKYYSSIGFVDKITNNIKESYTKYNSMCGISNYKIIIIKHNKNIAVPCENKFINMRKEKTLAIHAEEIS